MPASDWSTLTMPASDWSISPRGGRTSCHYFRQFLVSEFNEESLLFYLEVVEFKAQRFAKPKFGTTIVDADAMGEIELMHKRAAKLARPLKNSQPAALHTALIRSE